MTENLEASLQRFFSWCKRPAVRRIGLFFAALLFVCGFYLSFKHVGPDLKSLSYGPVVVVAIFVVPALILFNGVEMMLSARLVGVELSFGTSLKISVQASAANLLPLPAGPMLRAAAVMSAGGSAGRGGVAVLLPAIVWLGVGLVISAIAAIVLGVGLYIHLFTIAGLALILLAARFVRHRNFDKSAFLYLVGLKVVTALFDVGALYLLFLAIGIEIGPWQAAMLAASAPFGAAVAIVPSGLGVREIASSALGVLAGISAASAFLVPSLLRLIFLAALIPASLALAFFDPTDKN